MAKDVVIIGAGGHGKVIADIVVKSGDNVIGFLDDSKEVGDVIINKFAIIGKVEDCEKLQQGNKDLFFVIAIGNNYVRKDIFEKYKLNYYTAIHPTAVIGMDVQIGIGTVIMANACINSSAKIGNNCIINTGAIIEHDNVIEDNVHVSPNATLCGTVRVGECTHIGAGVTVRNNVYITSDCVIGAGGVVVKDIENKGTYIGVPVRRLEK